MATRKSTKKKDEVKAPERLFANVSPLSVGGVSLFDAGARVTADTVANFFSEEQVIYSAVDRLRLAGFEILQVSRATINIAGSLETYEKAFNTRIEPQERPVLKAQSVEDTATFWDSPDDDRPGMISTEGSAFADVIEGVAMEVPYYFMAPSMFAPTKEYWHLRVPGDVSLACNADRAHRGGIAGKGIKVAMVDSGWYKHPYFVGRGYRAAPVVLGPGTANPLNDEVGHGTGESANVFAVAPDVQLLPVKAMLAGTKHDVLVNSTAAFNAAVGLGPDIITCSWGFSEQYGPLSMAHQTLAAAVASAVASGIIIVFSAGNGHWGFPGQHPDVISAGGVFMEVDGSLQASNYASGFMSNIYSNRRVPDLSGLVGMSPGATYIMLPLEAGDSIDTSRAGGTHPPKDETAPDDGWAVFSGTSAAAPQLAGAAALIKQACPRLTPAEVRDILMKSAKDVTQGNCSPSTGANAAVVGPDTATGNGLVDAHKAVMLAKIRCLGPIQPIRGPIQPIRGPIEPIRGPIEPIRGPIEPIRGPIEPIRGPIEPIRGPIEPIRGPIEPIDPIRRPVEPVGPASGEMQQASGVESEPARPSLTAEDVEALEDLVLGSDLDIDDLP